MLVGLLRLSHLLRPAEIVLGFPSLSKENWSLHSQRRLLDLSAAHRRRLVDRSFKHDAEASDNSITEIKERSDISETSKKMLAENAKKCFGL